MDTSDVDRPISIARWRGVSAYWRPAGSERVELWIHWRRPPRRQAAARRHWAASHAQWHEAATTWRLHSPLGIADRLLTPDEHHRLGAFVDADDAALASLTSCRPPCRARP